MAATGSLKTAAAPPLRLAGSPGSLHATDANREPTATPTTAALVDVTSASGAVLKARSASVVGGKVRLRLDPGTPPGRYSGQIDVDGSVRPLAVDVVDAVALQIRPASLILDLATGQRRRASTAVENRGNVTLIIDLTGDYPLGEEMPLASAEAAPAEADGLQQLTDLMLRPRDASRGHVLRDAGFVTLSMAEGAVALEPGDSMVIVIDATFPAGLSATARYRAFIPLYDKDLELIAITAAKHSAPLKARPTRKQGATT